MGEAVAGEVAIPPAAAVRGNLRVRARAPSKTRAGTRGCRQAWPTRLSPHYNGPKYGVWHRSLSNFFLWSWLLHDRDDDDYEEEYIQANYDTGGWFVTLGGLVMVVLLVAGVWFVLRSLRKRAVA